MYAFSQERLIYIVFLVLLNALLSEAKASASSKTVDAVTDLTPASTATAEASQHAQPERNRRLPVRPDEPRMLEVPLEGIDPGASTAWRLGRVTTLGSLQLAVQYGALYTSQPENWKAFGNSLEPSWMKLRSNFDRAPVWRPVAFGGGGHLGYLQADGDPWTTNVIGHGLQGSEIYLRMRREGFPWGQAFAAGMVHSTMWEYGVEGWNETPSAWDLAYTPIGGLMLGELRYQLTHYLKGLEGSWFTTGLRIVVDPVHELMQAIN